MYTNFSWTFYRNTVSGKFSLYATGRNFKGGIFKEKAGLKRKILNRLIFVFSLLGLLISAFLFYEYSLAGSVACPIGQGCDIVRTSPFSNFLGISIPIWGLFFYFLLAIFAVFRLFKLQLLFAMGGFVFGVYLTFLEAFVIGTFCFWCVLSFIISFVILICTVKLKF